MKKRKNIFLIGFFVMFIIWAILGIGKNVYAAGENLSNAISLKVGETISGSFRINEMTKYYKFYLAQNSCIQISAKTGGHNQSVDIYLRNSTGKEPEEKVSTRDDYNWGYQYDKAYYALNAGTYYLDVNNFGMNPETYKITIKYTAISGKNIIVGGQNHNYLSKATYFNIEKQLRSVTNYDYQYYRFKLNTKQKLRIECKADLQLNMEGNYSDVYIEVLNSSGKNKLCEAWCEDKNNGKQSITTTLNKGTYYLRIVSWDRSTPYSIKILKVNSSITKVSTVSLQSLRKLKRNLVRIQWKKIKCDGYQMQISCDKYFKNRVILKNKIDKNKYFYNMKVNLINRRYYVRIRAYKKINGKNIYGKWSNVKSIYIK